MKTKIALALLVLSGAFFSNTISAQKKNRQKPNIIVILTDDQGWADVGFNGATDIPTPNLDRIAKEGTIFSNGYASHPYCSPSRAGLMTGRYQARFGHDCNIADDGVDNPTVGTPLSEKMIAEALKEQGYRTSAIGKWHLGDHPDLYPTKQGFDHWFGFPGGGMNYWGTSTDAIHTVYRNEIPVPETELTYLTDDFTEEAIKFITKKDQKPFFIYLAYNAPHAPDQATKQYLDNTKHIEYGGRSVYAAMVNAVDVNVGRIDSTLVAKKMKDNTIIVFLSDNGGRAELADNRPNRGHKGMIFEGGIKVPFFMTWKNGLKGNQVYSNVISSLDLFPTFLDAAGADFRKEKQLDGTSLLPYVRGENKGKPNNLLFWRSVGGFEYAVRKGDFKLYKSAYKGKTMLFNLKSDALERNDIAQTNPEIVSDLEQEYKKWDAINIAPAWIDPHPENVMKEEKVFQEIRQKSLKKVK
ncbi:sulfatase-like hydrolase/transferase [Flavobacterium sp. ARAG 55.4]|uniref:sulfatase-like hydrolase/transferase n=1 Tax=Flavobacterium sp. ARAG 55.4 TaxID=3451357 RepID=UPI003F45CFEB